VSREIGDPEHEAFRVKAGVSADDRLLVEDVLRVWRWWPCFLVQAMDTYQPGFFPSLQDRGQVQGQGPA
jgi:hypothetical protein